MGQTLRWALQDADISVLLAVLAHVTGDDTWLQEPYLTTSAAGHTDPSVGALPETVQEQVRLAAHDVLSAPRAGGAPALDDDRLRRIMSACVGEEVLADYVSMMREEMGLVDRFEPERIKSLHGRTDHSIVIIGAGPSGLCLAIQSKLAGLDVTVLEKNTDVGGTWLENRYPGAGVDTPSSWYSYSFRPGQWSRAFAKRDEVHRYLRRTAEEFGVLDSIRFGHRVESAHFDEAEGLWEITATGRTGDRCVFRARYLVSAVGQLNRPSVPSLPGADAFAGRQFHSAAWPEDLDLTGKSVAVVGTGASAMQLVPAIADRVRELTIFQRSPQWIAPHPDAHEVSERTAHLQAHVPYYAAWQRMRHVWTFGDKVFDTLVTDPDWPHPARSINAANDAQRKYLSRYLKLKLLGHPRLVDQCLPAYPPLAKRMLLDNGWFDTLKQPHVDLVTDAVARVTPRGVVDSSGAEHEADVIIYATGFDTLNPLGQIEIVGPSGRRLHDRWGRDDARAYLGISEPGFPNLFFLYGPNTNLGHGGSLVMINELQARYVLDLLRQTIEHEARGVECRPDVRDRYNALLDTRLAGMVWNHPGTGNWYRNERGRIVTNSPWRIVEHWWLTRSADLADYRLLAPTE